MNNPYEPWKAANDCLSEINQYLGDLLLALPTLNLDPFQKLIIQSHLFLIQQSMKKYVNAVEPIL